MLIAQLNWFSWCSGEGTATVTPVVDEEAPAAVEDGENTDQDGTSNEAEPCPICLVALRPAANTEEMLASDVELQQSRPAVITSCGHSFCRHCLLEMMSRDILQCPMCRRQLHDCLEKDADCTLCRVGLLSTMEVLKRRNDMNDLDDVRELDTMLKLFGKRS